MRGVVGYGVLIIFLISSYGYGREKACTILFQTVQLLETLEYPLLESLKFKVLGKFILYVVCKKYTSCCRLRDFSDMLRCKLDLI